VRGERIGASPPSAASAAIIRFAAITRRFALAGYADVLPAGLPGRDPAPGSAGSFVRLG
jgi:hypothetical protein